MNHSHSQWIRVPRGAINFAKFSRVSIGEIDGLWRVVALPLSPKYQPVHLESFPTERQALTYLMLILDAITRGDPDTNCASIYDMAKVGGYEVGVHSQRWLVRDLPRFDAESAQVVKDVDGFVVETIGDRAWLTLDGVPVGPLIVSEAMPLYSDYEAPRTTPS